MPTLAVAEEERRYCTQNKHYIREYVRGYCSRLWQRDDKSRGAEMLFAVSHVLPVFGLGV